jgi:hypothetical protein
VRPLAVEHVGQRESRAAGTLEAERPTCWPRGVRRSVHRVESQEGVNPNVPRLDNYKPAFRFRGNGRHIGAKSTLPRKWLPAAVRPGG